MLIWIYFWFTQALLNYIHSIPLLLTNLKQTPATIKENLHDLKKQAGDLCINLPIASGQDK